MREDTLEAARRLEARFREELASAESRVAMGGALGSGPILESIRRKWLASLALLTALRGGNPER